jgi:2-polyprenyl-6-methoxyphenol hydroxylase-like FAD-dependent oxidoreductase
MAGLLAACTLSRHFSRVTIVERDLYPTQAGVRSGVPQARHVHALLFRGLQIIENLLPGIRIELVALGGDLLDTSADFTWLTPAGWAPRFQSGLPFLAASRPLLEHVVRRRVATLSNVEFLENTAAVKLHATDNPRRISGVHVQSRTPGAPSKLITADLIVDASGRSSRTPDWLAALGYQPPPETIVDGHVGYASRIYRRKHVPGANWRATYSQAQPPLVCRFGLALPVEDDRWIVTLGGGGGDYPPTDEAAFVDFAKSLPNANIHNVIAASDPLSSVCSHRGTQNRLRHFENIRMPIGLLVLGDAACAFNPVYGQGMSTAAIAARLLDLTLSTGRVHEFQTELARELTPAWTLATSEDVRYPGAKAPAMTMGTRFMHWYVDRVLAASIESTRVRSSLLRVFHLVRSPASLFLPHVWCAMLAKAWRVRSGTRLTDRCVSLPAAAP